MRRVHTSTMRLTILALWLNVIVWSATAAQTPERSTRGQLTAPLASAAVVALDACAAVPKTVRSIALRLERRTALPVADGRRLRAASVVANAAGDLFISVGDSRLFRIANGASAASVTYVDPLDAKPGQQLPSWFNGGTRFILAWHDSILVGDRTGRELALFSPDGKRIARELEFGAVIRSGTLLPDGRLLLAIQGATPDLAGMRLMVANASGEVDHAFDEQAGLFDIRSPTSRPPVVARRGRAGVWAVDPFGRDATVWLPGRRGEWTRSATVQLTTAPDGRITRERSAPTRLVLAVQEDSTAICGL